MTKTDIWGRFLGQISSGRWLITIAATYCLILLTKTLCVLMEQGKIALEPATYIAIVMSVLNTIGLVTVFYFQKPRNGEDTNGDTVTVTNTTTTLPPKL